MHIVERLLTTAAQALHAPQLDPSARPPRISNAVAAIEAFETLSKLRVDGAIAPGPQTWQAALSIVMIEIEI